MNWKNCFAAWVAGLSLVGRLQAAADLPLPPEDETFFGARIPRTMSLLESSRPERRTPVKILIYGQSITAQPGWGQIVRKELERRYPYAKLEIENRAIGGCTAPYLAPHAINDLYPFYPDLVIFQVYEGEHDGALERIFSNIRRRTTAEIITWTEHVDNFIDRDSKREDGRRLPPDAGGEVRHRVGGGPRMLEAIPPDEQPETGPTCSATTSTSTPRASRCLAA